MDAYVDRVGKVGVYEPEDTLELESDQVPEEFPLRPALFDYLLGGFIVAMFATNYSAYNDLVSTIGMSIPVLLLVSLLYTRYHFQREFVAYVALCGWILLGAALSRFRYLSIESSFFVLKVQFVSIVVALRCSGFRRMRFYMAAIALGTAFIIVPSVFLARYMAYDARLEGGVHDPNALGAIAVCSFIAWVSLLSLAYQRTWVKWLICCGMALASLYVITLSASRGALLTIMFFAAVGYWYVWRRGAQKIKVLLSVVGIAAVIVVLFVERDIQIIDRFTALLTAFGIRIKSASAFQVTSGRVDLLKSALDIFYDHPVLGAGYGTFPAFTGSTYSHTALFDFLYATGIVGTCLYYFIVFSAWFVLGRARKLAADHPDVMRGIDIARLLIIAQLVAGLSLPTQQSKFQAVLTGIWLGVAWHTRAWIRQQEELSCDLPESDIVAGDD
jgi:O-antigen ligase